MDNHFNVRYSEEDWLFGNVPSTKLNEFLVNNNFFGDILELGCGDGRDTVNLINFANSLTAIDSSKEAIKKLKNRINNNTKINLNILSKDVINYNFSENKYDLIVGVTILDHLLREQINKLFNSIMNASKKDTFYYFEVHTKFDPGFKKLKVKSEFSNEILYYFSENELLYLFIKNCNIIWYEEKMEWDFDHGDPHQHCFAKILAKNKGE